MRDTLQQAIDEFNAGEWFECHETLEDLWVGSDGALRDFYQGTLQLAAALYHLRNENFKGCVTLLGTGMQCLRRVAPVCCEVDVEALVDAAERLREELNLLGPERMAEVGADRIPTIRYAGGSEG